jgi:hypothetical protein
MTKIKFFLFLSLALSTNSIASSYEDEKDRNDQSIPVAGALLTPTLKIKQGYDSNVTSAKNNEISSWYTIFQPSVKLTNEFGEFGKHNFEIDWNFTHGAYHASREDSYNDHDLSGKLNYELSLRHRFMLQGGYIAGHEERGTRFSIGVGDQLAEPDTYEQTFGGLQYTYGAPTSDARLELEVGYLDNDYRSVFIELAENIIYDTTAVRDRNTLKLGGTFYYNVGASTDITLEAWNSDISYDYTPRPQDELASNENRIMFGAKWEASASTTGFAKIGYIDKKFKLETRDSFDAVVWEAEILWEPKTYSKVTFRTAQTADETNGEGFFIDDTTNINVAHVIENTQHSIEWIHQWRERLTSKFGYAVSNDIYIGDIGKIREDNNSAVDASLFYDMNYWLSFSLDYRFTDRESTRANFTYDRQKIGLGVRMAIF